MIITIQIEVKPADVVNAANVMQAMYFSKNKLRETDMALGRKWTSYEDETYLGLSVANTIVALASKAVSNG